MSKIRFVTALFLLFSIIFGIGTYIFTPVSQIIATSWFQVFILSAQVAVLIFSCLNMIHVERQKKYNEKFAENVIRLAGSKPRMKE